MNDFNNISCKQFSFNIYLVHDNILGECYGIEALFVVVQLLEVNLVRGLHVIFHLREYLVAGVHILQFFFRPHCGHFRGSGFERFRFQRLFVELVLLFRGKAVLAVTRVIQISVVNPEILQRGRCIFFFVRKVVLLPVLVKDLLFHPVSDFDSRSIFQIAVVYLLLSFFTELLLNAHFLALLFYE